MCESVCVYLKPGAMGCIWMLFSSKSSFNSRRHKCNGCVSIDTFVSEVSPVEQPAPVKDEIQNKKVRECVCVLTEDFFPRDDY